MVLVPGDTSTTFVTALACFYLQIPAGHVEAGLRTYTTYPEEFNRLPTDPKAYTAMSTASNPYGAVMPAKELRIFWKLNSRKMNKIPEKCWINPALFLF